MLTRRAAFTFVEIVTAMIILGMLAAMLYPTIAAQLRSAQSGAVASTLENVRTAITNYQDNVDAFPNRVSLLKTQPVTGDDDSCGTNLSTAERNRWRGPYLTSAVVGDFPVGDATAKDTLIRVPTNDNTVAAGVLQLRLTSVDSTTAFDVEQQFDGGPNYATGSVLWTSTGPTIGTLTFQIAIRGC